MKKVPLYFLVLWGLEQAASAFVSLLIIIANCTDQSSACRTLSVLPNFYLLSVAEGLFGSCFYYLYNEACGLQDTS